MRTMSPDGLYSSTLDVFRSNKMDVESCRAALVLSQSRATETKRALWHERKQPPTGDTSCQE